METSALFSHPEVSEPTRSGDVAAGTADYLTFSDRPGANAFSQQSAVAGDAD